MSAALFVTCTQVDTQKKHIPAIDFTLLNWLTISGGNIHSNVPTKQAKHDLKYLKNWLCKFSLRKETHLTQYIKLQSNTQCSQPSSNSLRRQTKISSSKKEEGKSNIKKSKLEKPLIEGIETENISPGSWHIHVVVAASGKGNCIKKVNMATM